MKSALKMDLHMHSTISDGTDAPEALPGRVRDAGIDLFALTDHDAVKGCDIIRGAIGDGDPLFINGVEFSCRDDGGKYHILGYGYDPDSPSIQRVVQAGHSLRMKKLAARLDALRAAFGFVFPEEEVQRLMSLDNPGKPHLGNLMVKYGYVASKEQAINEFINRAGVRDEYICPGEAIEGILRANGIPVLAHPPFGSGSERILGDDMDRRLRRLVGIGLRGVEGFYSGYTPRLQAETLSFAEKYGLYVTAGSDYHGRNKTVALGDTHIDSATAMPDGMRRFLEAVGVA